MKALPELVNLNYLLVPCLGGLLAETSAARNESFGQSPRGQ